MIIRDPEVKRKLKLMTRLSGLGQMQIIEDAIELYYEVYDVASVDKEAPRKVDEKRKFQNSVYMCNGSSTLKKRIINILEKRDICTHEDFMRAPIGEIMQCRGVGKYGRALLTEMVTRELQYARK